MSQSPRSSPNFFTLESLERWTMRRCDPDWISTQMSHSATRFVPVWRAKNFFTSDRNPKPVILSPADLLGVKPRTETLIFLGEQNGVTHFAVDLPGTDDSVPHVLRAWGRFRDLRQVGAVIDERLAAILAYARAMASWHSRNRHCTRCGSLTESGDAGHVRRCRACEAVHFPRTDPAVIVLVVGTRGCLLGRNASWTDGLYSAIAGFVEPGESLEGAVVREVREETGVQIADIRYHSSQPWPFPSSIMLGFTARATDCTIQINDVELEDARWFKRKQIREAVAAGTLRLPNRISIAYRLLEDWFNKGRAGLLQQFVDH